MESNRKKIPCTVEILTYNSEKTLSRAIESVKDFAEIIILDGGSSDNTLEIARGFGCLILKQGAQYKNTDGTLRDFGGVRNQGLRASSHEWFFFLDSDEYLGSAVVSEIQEIISQNNRGVYFIPRKYVYKDVVIECSVAYPNYQMRFFHRSCVREFIKEVHERIQLVSGGTPKYLAHYMYVPLPSGSKDLYARQKKYLIIEANRRMNIPMNKLLRGLKREFFVGLKYLWRIVAIYLFCHKTKLPFSFEWMRVWYQGLMVKLLLGVFLKKIFYSKLKN